MKKLRTYMKAAQSYCAALSNKKVCCVGLTLIAIHYALVVFVPSYESATLFVVGGVMITLTMTRRPSKL